MRPAFACLKMVIRETDRTRASSSADTRKGKRISEIKNQGVEIIVSVLADDLSELQALKLEAELIAAFGTEDTGGLLTNSVLPTGKTSKPPKNVVIPVGVREKAQLALRMLKEAVIELAQANADGVTNAEAAKSLGLQSDYAGGSKDFLSFSLLGLLMRDGKISRGEKAKYKALVR